MDLLQAFIIYAGWIFFTAWGMVLAAISVVTFGRDILPRQRVKVEVEPSRKAVGKLAPCHRPTLSRSTG